MSHMLLESIREDEDIIKINDAKDIEEFTKTIVSISLKRCRGVSETEGHNEIFKVTIASTEGSFVFIAFCNPQLIVRICHIEARKVFSAFETIAELRDERESVTILDCDIIELAVIDA